eukprot:CAMPEP_0116146354 /NCGR_PEP_ID=MMETSP0329-20121206/17120_1 /TAXON_ID=697910 /ORGANISM="Pseudo-nitzschia arenysensis, Strain B593" /LENGTH=488 /DNA_ID=CAMNT_0003642097 /DNA_START=41 /DNA_END=1507 /DNA_ORIENTATION=+
MTAFWENDGYEWIEGSDFGGEYEMMESRNLASSASGYGILFCFQVITSLMSVFATIVVVRISVPKLDSTYQRYIFMLNVSLLVNSIFLALHPILIPNDSGEFWSAGNAGTCTMVGFFLVFGSTMVSLYHTAIAFYFYFSVETIQGNYNNRNQRRKKNSMNDTERRMTRTSGSESSDESSTESSDDSSSSGGLGTWAEVIANMVCLFFPVILAGTAAGLKSFGFDPSMNLCTLASSSGFYYDDSWEIMRDVYLWTLVVSSLSTVLITTVVRCRVRFFQKKDYDDDAGDGAAASQNKNSNASGSSLGDPDGNADDFERQIIGQKLSAIAAQCLFYTVSYVSSFLWFITLAFLSKSEVPEGGGLFYTFQTLTVIFYPLLGVFNCAIYVRPRVQMLHIMYPEDSQLAIMRVAMSKAGDPEEIEEVRAKIFGDDYYAPEEDDAEGSNRPDRREDEDDVSKLEIPNVVQISSSRAGSSNHIEDDKDSVSQISDI